MNNAVIRGDELNSSYKQSSSFSSFVPSEVITTCNDSYCNDDDLIDNNNEIASEGERNHKANNEPRNSDAGSNSAGISLIVV